MAFINDLYCDEIRCGWLVKSDIKKVWNRQLEIWTELDRICRKHAITYWAGYGTLLGAARHGGFIPWDTDMDFCMMRPEFNRFCAVVKDELISGGGLFELGLKIFSDVRIAHSQTTLLERKDLTDGSEPKGWMIEVFPLDVAPDGTQASFWAANALNELMGTIYNFPAIVEHVKQGGNTLNDWDVIEALHNLGDLSKQYDFITVYATELFNQSSAVNWIEDTCRNMHRPVQQKAWFNETIYLPFESVQLPAPAAFNEILTSYYGDWHKFVRDAHSFEGFIYSADIPHKDFWKRVDLKFL